MTQWRPVTFIKVSKEVRMQVDNPMTHPLKIFPCLSGIVKGGKTIPSLKTESVMVL